MFRLATLGRLSLANGAATDAALPRRRLAILALLANAGERGVTRDKLIAYLWPDSSADDARHSLEQLLYSVRRQLDAGVFAGIDPLRLNPRVITSDLAAFRDALSRGADEEAIAEYQGPFLDGFYLTDAPEFERWVEEERLRVRVAYGNALERVAAAASVRSDWDGAVAAWRALTALDGLNARYTHGLVRAIAGAGDVPGALRAALAYESLLSRELNLPVDASLTQLVHELRSAPPRPPSTRAPAVESTKGGANEPPFVESLQPKGDAITAPVPHANTPGAPRRRRSIVAGILLAIPLALGAVWLAAAGHARSSRPASIRPRVVVAVFENRTGDSTLDKFGIMAADYTRIALAKTNLLDVIGPSFDLWNPLNARPAHQASLATIVRQTGATLIISGGYYRDGDTLVFAVVGTDAASQRVVFAFDSIKAGVRQLREAIEQVRQHVMSAIATRVDSALIPWAGNASTPPVRFDAYQLFADGMTSFVRGMQTPRVSPVSAAHFASALASLERSYHLDSTYFAPAIWSIFARSNIGDLIGADSVIRALAPRRTSMSPYEGTLYDYVGVFVDGTPERRYQLDRTLINFAPASEFRYCLARDALQAGHTKEALAEMAVLDDSYSWTRILHNIPSFRIRAHAQLREFEKALTLAREIQHTSPSDLSVIFPEIDVLSATGRLDEIAQLVDRLSVAPGVSGASAANLMLYAGLRLSSASDPARARSLFARALAYYDSVASATGAPDAIIFGRARSLYYLEQWDESRSMFMRLAKQPLGSTRYDRRAVIFLGALAARRGDTSDVSRLRTILQRSVGTRAEKAYFDATVAALLGQKGHAIEILNSAISLGAQIMEVMMEGDAAPSMNPDFAGLRPLHAYQRVVALW